MAVFAIKNLLCGLNLEGKYFSLYKIGISWGYFGTLFMLQFHYIKKPITHDRYVISNGQMLPKINWLKTTP